MKAPDEFQSIFGKSIYFVLSHRKWTLILVGGALLSYGAYLGLEIRQNRVDAEASDAFQKLIELSRSESIKTEEDISKDIDPFLSKYGSSSMAPLAELMKGKTLLNAGKYTQAESIFRSAKTKMDYPYSILADEGIASALMEQKKWDETILIWSILSEHKDSPLRASHLWKLGLTQEAAGKKNEALETYQKFEKEYKESTYLENVRARITALKS